MRYNSDVPDPSHNPYAPPRAGAAPQARTSDRAPGEALKWIYAFVGASYLLASVARAVGLLRAYLPIGLLGMVHLWVSAAWIFHAWNGVPAPFRGGVSPSGAVGRFFVPIFNVYWFFVVNAHLCTALDSALTAAHLEPRAPRTLRWLAPFAHAAAAVSGALFAFTPALQAHPFLTTAVQTPIAAVVQGIWFFYMLRCDDVRREVARTSPRTERLASFWPLFIFASLAMFLCLAIWQFFSPIPHRP